jgi:hypothetical protein
MELEVVSGTYFSVLGVSPALGRLLTEDDDQAPGASSVAVMSYDFWRVQLGSAPDAVGRRVLIDQHPMTIVDVASPGFKGIDVGEGPSLWIPAAMSGASSSIPRSASCLRRSSRCDRSTG